MLFSKRLFLVGIQLFPWEKTGFVVHHVFHSAPVSCQAFLLLLPLVLKKWTTESSGILSTFSPFVLLTFLATFLLVLSVVDIQDESYKDPRLLVPG